MFRPSQFALTAALALCATLAVVHPAQAQAGASLGELPKTVAASASQSAFLVRGLAAAESEGQQASSGSRPHEGVGFGVKGGFLWPSFGDAQGSSFEENTGWLLGLFFGGNRGGAIGAQGEIQYGKRGASAGPIDFEQYFLEIPILARINVGANNLNGILIYGLAGPVFDINLTTKLDGIDVADNYESVDVGLLVGGGIEITRFFIEARYNKGFRNVLKRSGAGITDATNQYFGIQLGVRFN